MADVERELVGADARLRRSVERALSLALAGAAHEMHGHLEWLSRQLFPETAERAYLARYGGRYGLTFKPPTAATRNVTIAGTNGNVCLAGTLWQRGDGTTYTQNADATIASGTASIVVTCLTLGTAGNADVGVKLSLVNPVSGINAEGTVASGGVDGFDEETESEFLARVLQRMQNVPQGGGPGDYVRWALEVAGVTKAWERASWLGLGNVGVSFLVGDNAIPSGGQVAAVAAHIETKRPITVGVTVFAPTAVPVNYTLHITPDTAAIRTAVQNELADFHRREAELGGTLYLTRQLAAVSAAADLSHFIQSAPGADSTAAPNELRTLGTVTFV